MSVSKLIAPDPPERDVQGGKKPSDRPGRWAAGARGSAGRGLGWTRGLLGTHAAMAGVIAAWLLTPLVIPVLAPVAISDDWTYTRSVEILLDGGGLRILDIAGASAIPQIVWGAAFAAFTDNVFGAVRLATVVFTGLSAVAVYLLCRELTVGRTSSALAAALFLANPIVLGLGYSFMTDPYYLGLLAIASWLYARGLRVEVESALHTVLGSAVAGLAVTQRVVGVLIPIAVAVHLLATRRLPLDRAGVERFLRIVGLPLAAFVAFQLWMILVHGVPSGQRDFSASILDATWPEAWLLVRRLSFIVVMYTGMFVLPLAVVALTPLRSSLARLTTASWLTVVVGVALIVAGLSFFAADGRLMPYVPHFFQGAGLGPNDLVIGRPSLMTPLFRAVLTYASAISAVVLLIAAMARRRGVRSARRGLTNEASAVRLCATLAGFQLLAVLLPSFAFRDWLIADGLSSPSLDRYLVPVLPFAIVFAVWIWQRLPRANLIVAWALVALLGVTSTVGMRDQIVFQRTTWDLATWANDQGIDNTRLDGGFAWHAYHMYGVPPAEGNTPIPGSPWWITAFAPVSDSSYVIAAQPIPDYHTVRSVEFDQWLAGEAGTLYLQRRPGVAGPP
jgi:hypothetical protein